MSWLPPTFRPVGLETLTSPEGGSGDALHTDPSKDRHFPSTVAPSCFLAPLLAQAPVCQQPQAQWYTHLSLPSFPFAPWAPFKLSTSSPCLFFSPCFIFTPSVAPPWADLSFSCSHFFIAFFSSQLLFTHSLKFCFSLTFCQPQPFTDCFLLCDVPIFVVPPFWHPTFPSPAPFLSPRFCLAHCFVRRCWHLQPPHLAVSAALFAVACILLCAPKVDQRGFFH